MAWYLVTQRDNFTITLVSRLMGEHRLRVFGSRVLKIQSGPKREEVTGGWRKLHNEELLQQMLLLLLLSDSELLLKAKKTCRFQ